MMGPIGTAMAAASTLHRATLAARLAPRHLRVLCSTSNNGTGEVRRQLVLYSKPGCCLCDGLKEKLTVAFSLDGPYSLHSVDLQVRDITMNPEWEQKYQYEIPVLARVLPDGTEQVLPRLSPRLGVELIQKKISTAFDQFGILNIELATNFIIWRERCRQLFQDKSSTLTDLTKEVIEEYRSWFSQSTESQ